MKVKDKIFNSQKTINQVIKHVRSSLPQDQQNLLNEHLNDIKKELKQSDPRTLSIALQKLFFVSYYILPKSKARMEGIDLRSMDYAIMNCLSSNSFGPRRMACLTIPISIDPKSSGLFMATNLFKKEIMKSNEVEVSCILSCLTNVVTVDMGPVLIDGTLKLLKSQKPILRKKAMALVAKIFSICPSTIQGNLETILESVIINEDNPTVLACFTSIVNSVLNTQSKLYPLFVKPLYDLFQKHKSNWFMIKMIKTFHKMIKLEPRLVKKLQEPYSSILATTKSKALEYELLNSIIEFFHEDAALYEVACEKLKVFIEHDDPNLQSLGFNLLNKMVSTNPSMITEYKQFLLDTFDGTNDTYTKVSILDILENFMNASIYKEFVEVVLKQIDLTRNEYHKAAGHVMSYAKFQARAISSIIKCTRAEDYAFVSDYNWLVGKVIASLSKNVLEVQNATQIQELIYDLMVRVDGLSETIFKLSLSIIKGFAKCELENQPFKEEFEKLKQNSCKMLPGMKRIRASEVIFQTFLFIFGEYSHHIQFESDLRSVLDLLNDTQIIELYTHSSYEIQTSLIKAIVKFNSLGKDQDEKMLNSAIEIVKVILQKQETNEGNQLDLITRILLGFNPQESQLQETLILMNKLLPPFEPIHPDAQKFIEVPEGLNINEEIFKNPEEIQKITQKCNAFFSMGKSKEPQVSIKDKSSEVQTTINNSTQDANNLNKENNQEVVQNGKENELEGSTTALLKDQENRKDENVVEQPQKLYTVKKFAFVPQKQNGNKNPDEDSGDEGEQ